MYPITLLFIRGFHAVQRQCGGSLFFRRLISELNKFSHSTISVYCVAAQVYTSGMVSVMLR